MNATLEHTPKHTTKIIDFAQENLSLKLVDEMVPLWIEHYEEIALYKDLKLSPLMSVYENAQSQKLLRIYTARHDGELVGYQVLFVHPHPHYSEILSANQDILFLAASMRRGLIGYRFIKWCDEQLKHDGVGLVFQHVKTTHNFGPLLQRMGYVEHDIIFSRRL